MPDLRTAVLDTNIFVAAFATPWGVCGKVYDAWHQRAFQLVTSEYILEELERVLKEKLFLDRRYFISSLDAIRELSRLVTPEPIRLPGVDTEDLPILGTACAAEADALVTGDRILLTLKKVNGIPIVTPKQFLEMTIKE